MKPYWVSLALAVSFTALAQTAPPLPSAPPESVGMSSQRLAKINAALKKEVADGSFRGAVVMVARKGKLVYQDAVGMQTADAPMRAGHGVPHLLDDQAAGVGRGDDAGRGRPHPAHRPGRQVPAGLRQDAGERRQQDRRRHGYSTVAAERPMTVQDLLRHTSGLAYGEITQNAPVKEAWTQGRRLRKDLDYEARGMTPSEQVERLAKVPLRVPARDDLALQPVVGRPRPRGRGGVRASGSASSWRSACSGR